MNNRNLLIVTGFVFIVLVGAFLLQSTFTGYFSKGADKTAIAYRPHVLYLPVFVAVENNLFEKHGLNVELKEFEKTEHILLAMETGKIAASFGGVNLLDLTLAKQRGSTAKLFSVTVVDKEHRITCLVSKNFNNVRFLSGKKIGYPDSPIGLLWSNATFNDFNLDSSGFIPLKNSLLLQSVSAGSTDAVFLLEPDCAKAESLGYNIVVNEPLANHFADNLYLTTSVFSGSVSNGEKRALTLVYDEAVEFIRSNPETAKEILAKYTKIDKELVERVAISNFLKSNEWSVEQLQESIDVLKKTGVLNEVGVESLVSN